MEVLEVKTSSHIEMVNITYQIQSVIEKSGVKEGTAVVYTPHTTAAITINESADPDVVRDILYETNKIIPLSDNYHHLEGNSAAHIKSSLFGASETLIIENGRIQLGTWQGIFFCEFDGPRTRKIHVRLMA